MSADIRQRGALAPRFVFAACVLSGAITLAQQQAPIFRSKVDLLQLDVTVLDKNGRPVRGLTKDDFVLLEDKTQQTILGFSAVDLPDRTAGGPVWSDRVTSDITTNEIENARIFILVIDDALSMGVLPPPAPPGSIDPGAVDRMKDGAEAFLKSLGPLDLAAIVFTQRTNLGQNLTADKAKLITAVRAFPKSLGGDLLPGNVTIGGKTTAIAGTACLGPTYSVGTMEGLVRALASMTDRRKAIVYFGGVLPWRDTPDPPKGCTIYWRWRDVFALAQQANVTINPVDTMGLRVEGTAGSFASYGAVAENTGGRAVIGNNDLKPGLERIRIENSSYYLLAYQPTKGLEDGTFRRLTVTVKNRPDVEIVARRNYWAPRTRPAGQGEPEPLPPEVDAVSGLLPKADLRIRATAAPFAVPGADGAVVALAIGLKQPPLLARTPETIELVIKNFTADGHERGSDTQTIPITVPASRADAPDSRYDVLARATLPKAGRYEIRIAAHSAISNTRGSVYLDVTVPDFRKDRVSLSGIILSALPAPGPVAPARALADLTPLVPMTERIFGAGDVVTAFARVYQGGNDAMAATTVTVRIVDAADKPVFEHAEPIAADRFDVKTRSADYQTRLRADGLAPGTYLLSIEAAAGRNAARRDIVFTIR